MTYTNEWSKQSVPTDVKNIDANKFPKKVPVHGVVENNRL